MAPHGASPIFVSEIMTIDLVMISPDATIVEAAQTMRANDVGSVFVAEGDEIVGLVTDRDLVVRVLANGLDPVATSVAEALSAELVCIPPSSVLDDVDTLMRDRAVRRLPVVSHDGQAFGIVSLGDLARAQDPDSALAVISASSPSA